MSDFNLEDHGITVQNIVRNPPPAILYEEAMKADPPCSIADSGALIAYSGTKTGRSPLDKRVVKNPESENDIWWGSVNVPLEALSFHINRERAKDYLNTKDRLYCVDNVFSRPEPEFNQIDFSLLGLVRSEFFQRQGEIAEHGIEVLCSCRQYDSAIGCGEVVEQFLKARQSA